MPSVFLGELTVRSQSLTFSTFLYRSNVSKDLGKCPLKNFAEVAEDTPVPVWVPCPSSVTCLFPMNGEYWALHLLGWFSWKCGLHLGTAGTQIHVAPLSSTGSITQEGGKDIQETNNIWKCLCEISQSLSAQKPLSCVGKAQIKCHSLL